MFSVYTKWSTKICKSQKSGSVLFHEVSLSKHKLLTNEQLWEYDIIIIIDIEGWQTLWQAADAKLLVCAE